MGHTMKRDAHKMGGHSLCLVMRYDVTSRWSAGAGAVLARYTRVDYNTLPVFATVRYKLFERIPSAYTFTDVGYALDKKSFARGFLASQGLGYTYMLSRRFGFNFQIGYNLKNFREDLKGYNSERKTLEPYVAKSHRHSLTSGIGLVF